MKIKQIFSKNKLPNSDTERLDLELLLCLAMKCSRSFIYANYEYELSGQVLDRFNFLFNRRLKGEPMAYIIGKKEFWGLEFVVNNKVLIPRPETEILIELALEKIVKKQAKVVDLGTGSGAIAISLAKERPGWMISATDLSRDALQVASYNAMSHKICNISFHWGAWLEALASQEIFDAIVSNPPYIASDSEHLSNRGLTFEPRMALVSGDGLEALREIIWSSIKKLNYGGWLILECGYDQNEKIVELLTMNNYQNITVHQDLAGISRAVVAQKVTM